MYKGRRLVIWLGSVRVSLTTEQVKVFDSTVHLAPEKTKQEWTLINQSKFHITFKSLFLHNIVRILVSGEEHIKHGQKS